MSMSYLILEVRRALRSTRFLIFTIAMPVALFLLYVGIFAKNDGVAKGVLMVNMTCYGALTAALFAGGRVAIERAAGWQRQLRLTLLSGLTAAAELHRELPSCRIVVCTTFGRPGYLARAMAAGVAGFVVKDAPPEQLVDAVRRVHSGLRVVDPSLAAESLATGQNPLTERERDVLRVSIEGGTIADVAQVLHLSQGTVRNHLSSAIGKTGARTRAEAAKLAEERGWL